MDEYYIPFASQALRIEFDDFAEKCFMQISALQKSNLQLSKARDLLLPGLMDGRIAV
jgi:hypothetical protein